jgi:type III secretory pathway component EscS
MRTISETIKALIIVNIIFFIGSSFLGEALINYFLYTISSIQIFDFGSP